MYIKDYLCYYIGQPCIISHYNGDTFKTEPLTATNYASYIDSHTKFSYNIASIKPILRRLEDMTEEEICKMALAGGLIGTPTRANIEGNFIQMEYVKDGEILVEHWHPNELNAQHFHFLLSRGFDLFGLIDAGLGIDAKTINTI